MVRRRSVTFLLIPDALLLGYRYFTHAVAIQRVNRAQIGQTGLYLLVSFRYGSDAGKVTVYVLKKAKFFKKGWFLKSWQGVQCLINGFNSCLIDENRKKSVIIDIFY